MIIGDRMKRKIYFLISALIQIGTSVYGIFTVPKLVKAMMDTISFYPESMQGRINTLLQNSGNTYFIVLACINIILNIFIIVWALNDKLLRHKGKVIGLSVVSIFTASYSIIELCAIINIIVMASAKREREEDFPKKKEAMPDLKKESVNKTKIILAIVLFAIYFSQFLWKGLIPENDTIELIISVLFYLTMIVLSIIFMYDLLKDNFKIFRENFKAYVSNLAGSVGKFYLIYLVVAMIAALLSNADTTVNQSNIEALPIWLSLPLAVIYAPLVEESLFRGCIRRFIKNDKIFIIVSAISFGLLHTIFTEVNLYNAIVLGIPYITIGGFLAYLYVKTNNICTNMAFHAFHNGIVMIFVILLKGI